MTDPLALAIKYMVDGAKFFFDLFSEEKHLDQKIARLEHQKKHLETLQAKKTKIEGLERSIESLEKQLGRKKD